MARIDRIKNKLSVLKPHFCRVIDESHKHASHTNNSLESHFHIEISATIFTGKQLLTQHRMIKDLLADEFKEGMHAFSIKIL